MLKIEDFDKKEIVDLMINEFAFAPCACGKNKFGLYKKKDGTAGYSRKCYDCNMAAREGDNGVPFSGKEEKKVDVPADELDF